MASASPRPIFSVGSVLSPIAIPPAESVPQQHRWIRPAAAVHPVGAVTWGAPEPRGAVDWRFGDLTLIGDVRPFGPPLAGPLRAPQLRHQGCVALLCSEADEASSTLFISPRAGLALAALQDAADQFGSVEARLALLVPEDWLDNASDASVLPVRRIETETGPGALLAGFMRQLAGQSRHVSDEQARSLAIAMRALLEACVAPAGKDVTANPTAPSSSIVERARQIVQRHMGSPDFGPPQLGRLLAMSRSKLYRLLDGDGGVAHFINRERLLQARRDLTTSGEPLSVHAIASRVGFRDHSTFSRAFRREYGCSPSRLRERLQSAHPEPGRPRPGLQDAGRADRPCCALCKSGGENGMNSPDLGF